MIGAILNLLTKSLPKLLTERPDLLVDHALAYAALAKGELETVKRQMFKRAVAGAVALASGLAFVMLSGVAVMLCAVLPGAANASWVLLAVPGLMLLVTLVATVVALTKGTPAATGLLAAQMRLDAQAFRSVMESRT
jgi:hypothetical protein